MLEWEPMHMHYKTIWCAEQYAPCITPPPRGREVALELALICNGSDKACHDAVISRKSDLWDNNIIKIIKAMYTEEP